jgi:hypothetical protein
VDSHQAPNQQTIAPESQHVLMLLANYAGR